MANDRIKGITIEIGGDTKKLSTALSNADKEIKSTQHELKEVEKLLKVDPSNVELLAQKEKLLADNVAQVADKLELLKEAEAQAQEQFKQGKISQEQYDGLKKEIIATEQALQKAKEQADAFNSKLLSVQETTKKISDATGTVAKKTEALSAVSGALVTSIGALAYKTVQLSDDLNTLANQSGLTTAEIQKFQYASDVVDVSTETIVGALSKMRKNMDSTSSSTQEAWSQLGISTRDAEGNLRDSTTVFYEVLEALGQIENGTERDVVAMQIFGKSADQLAGIVDDGGQALKELGDQAEASGLILSQDTLDSLNVVNDKIDILKATIEKTLATTGAKAMETLEPVFNWVIEKVGAVLEWVGNLDEGDLKLILTIGTLVATISPIAGIVSKLTSTVSGIVTLLPKITAFATANPVLLIASAVALLATLIIENWDTIKPILDAIKEKVKEVFSVIVDWGKSKINALLTIINSMINGINTLISGLNSIQFDVPDWIPLLGGKKFGFNIPYIRNIPLLAQGGIVGNGGTAIVGERGAEVLTNVNGNAVVTPLTANIDTSAITSAIKQGQGNQNITIEFSGSLAQLGRVLQPVIKSENSRIGGSLVNV